MPTEEEIRRAQQQREEYYKRQAEAEARRVSGQAEPEQIHHRRAKSILIQCPFCNAWNSRRSNKCYKCGAMKRKIDREMQITTAIAAFGLLYYTAGLMYPNSEHTNKGDGGALAAALGSFSTNQVCKAGIAIAMGRDPAIIRVDRTQKEVVYLSYTRQNDQWTYKCKLHGNTIVWGADDGRWQDDPRDSKITFSVNSDILNVEERFNDGSVLKMSFISKQLSD